MREYAKKMQKFADAKPTPKAAKAAADEAFEAVLASVADPELHSRLDQLISDNKEKASDELEKAQSLAGILFNQKGGTNEIAMGDNIGFSIKKTEKIIQKTSITHGIDQEISVSSIIEKTTEVHSKVIKELDAARKLPKDQKKRRKRDLMSASASASFGISIIVMNLVVPPTFWLSLAAGMTPLGQAIRDVVGTKQ
jgi:alcohol dehydrogenase class IV